MNNNLILALETSHAGCGVCVYSNENSFAEVILMKQRSHASMLPSVIDSACRQMKVKPSDLDAIAYSAGPGSFTGLRIGLSTAKGLALGAEKPLIAVPTFEAMALQAALQLPENEKFALLRKVNTTELFFATGRISGGMYHDLSEVRALPFDQVKELLEPDRIILAEQNWFQSEKYVNFPAPKPSIVALWAQRLGTIIPVSGVDSLEPMYLKEFVIKKKA